MRAFLSVVALSLALVTGTALAGWWTVPVISGLWTLAAPRRGAVLYASFAGALAWGALLLWSARLGPVGAMDRLLGQILHVPAGAVLALTVAYAALLAGAAALVAQALRPPTFTGSSARRAA